MLEMTDDCCTKIKPEEETVKNESRSDSDDDSIPELEETLADAEAGEGGVAAVGDGQQNQAIQRREEGKEDHVQSESLSISS